MSEPKETKGRGRPATGVTPAHKLTCPDELWQKMIMVAAGGGSSLSAETRAFYAWYTCQPGAQAPRRPSAVTAVPVVCTCDTDPRGCVVHGPSARATDR